MNFLIKILKAIDAIAENLVFIKIYDICDVS